MRWQGMVATGVGGAVGAGLRWAVVTVVGEASEIPWPVLGVNIAGSLMLGLLMATEPEHPRARVWLHDVGGIGFCGGLTTFSTLARDIVALLEDGMPGAAAVYLAATLVAGIGAAAAGMTIATL